MDEPFVAVVVTSLLLAAWTYSRAWKMHNSIEARWPGFNAHMRSTCRFLKRMGWKE